MQVRIIKVDARGDITNRDTAVFTIPAVALREVEMIPVVDQINSKLGAFIRNGSGWIVEGVDFFKFHVTRFHSVPRLRGHGTVFQLPKRLVNKKAIVNVKNTGSDCFRYALLSVLHYNDITVNRDRPNQYAAWLNEHNWEGIEFPFTAAQVKKFEKNNPGLRITLLEWDEEEKHYPVRVLYHTKDSIQPTDRVIPILAVEDSKNKDSWHYVGVTNLSRLLNMKDRHLNNYCKQ